VGSAPARRDIAYFGARTAESKHSRHPLYLNPEQATMENPQVDIESVVEFLMSSGSPDVQRATVRMCVLYIFAAPYRP